MNARVIRRSTARLVLNAEPFGFGPTAALAAMFPYLRDRFGHIGYLGKGHTLDLQRALPYDAVHDLSGLPPAAERKAFDSAASSYDVFLTALDFVAAEWAVSIGLRLFVYDMLAWYRPDHDVPEVLKEGVYIVQDFFGVRERIESRPDLFPRVCIVPPLVADTSPRQPREHVLINFAGLQTPLSSIDDITAYVRMCIDALTACLPPGTAIFVAASSSVRERIGDPRVQTYSQEQVQQLLQRAKYACMTPGLGNIYEAARHDVPTIWLPPVSDSQGQQLDALKRHGLTDAHVDWSDFTERKPVDYFASQPRVLQEITSVMREAVRNSGAIECFRRRLARMLAAVQQRSQSKTVALIARFGSGGAKVAAEVLLKHVEATTAPVSNPTARR